MTDIVQTYIKAMLNNLSENYVDGIQGGNIEELITILRNGETFRSFLTQAMDDAFVDQNGQFRSNGLESVVALACRESTRLSNHALATAKGTISEEEKLDVWASLKELKNQTDELMGSLARSKFWRNYPAKSVPIMTAWLTEDGEAVGQPYHRMMPKDEPVFMEKCYIGVLESENSFDIPAPIFVLPKNDYRMDDGIGKKVRQEFIVNISSMIMGMLLGQHKSMLDEDRDSPFMPKIPEAKFRSINSKLQDYLHDMFAGFANVIEASATTVETLMNVGLITGYHGFELYEQGPLREPKRAEVKAEDNPEAAFEIGAFS